MNKMKFGLPNQEPVEILFPIDMQRASNNVEERFSTEAGTDEFILTRKDKQNISMSFKCTSYWVGIFKSFYMQDSFLFTEYNPITNSDEVREVKMTGYTEKLVKNSWDVPTSITNGVWEVSFVLQQL